MLLVTGGAGFIGANFILEWLKRSEEPVISLDSLTYAGNLEQLPALTRNPRYTFIHGDIRNSELLEAILAEYKPRAVIHLAAESHVDRSIDAPAAFFETNVEGTFCLLEAARAYWATLGGSNRAGFRFLHVSTDEVYGSLEPDERAFRETSALAPNSPYSASKAASDHLVRAWHQTFGLPVLTTRCTNNYGPYQFPEKLIPLMLARALAGKTLPVYGDGMNIRDWIYVGDHCKALRSALAYGRVGDVYNIGSRNQRSNIEVVRAICATLDDLLPDLRGSYQRLIRFVPDRAGHDRRYAIDPRKIETGLGWLPTETFESGLRRTVEWFVTNTEWVEEVQSGAYQQWIETHYAEANQRTTA